MGDCGGTLLEDFPSPAVRDTEYRVVAKINTVGDRFTEISATVQNMTTWPARYAEELTIRYYFDLSEVFAAGFTLDDVIAQYRVCHLCSSDSLPFRGPLPVSGNPDLFYIEIGFDGEKIYPGGQSAYRREVQFRIGLPETAPQGVWDPSNDPSFVGLTTSVDTTGHKAIPLYEKGRLMWGTGIDGISFSPPTWDRPAFPIPSYAFSGWNNDLFKGVDPDAVQPGRTVAAARLPFSLERRHGTLKITARNRVTVTLVTIDGREIMRSELEKNGIFLLQQSQMVSGLSLLRLSDGKGYGTTVPLYRY